MFGPSSLDYMLNYGLGASSQETDSYFFDGSSLSLRLADEALDDLSINDPAAGFVAESILDYGQFARITYYDVGLGRELVAANLTAVPEPASLALLALGLAAFGLSRRKKS